MKKICKKADPCASPNSHCHFSSLLFLVRHKLFVTAVVYFDQLMGALHAICWSKSFVSVLKQFFSSFTDTNGKKNEKRKERAKITQKNGKTVLASFNYFNQQRACTRLVVEIHNTQHKKSVKGQLF